MSEPHVHVDHQYVALVESPVPVSEPAHPFGWFSVEELAELSMFEDTLLLARALFPRIGSITSAERDDEAVLRVLSPAGLS
ncbi:MAG: hypothetical protein ACRDQU_08660 [Pseudonocardiaceae bacterium]